MTGYAGDIYSYDLQNRMIQASVSGGGTVRYGYDTTNHRVYKGGYNTGTTTYSAEEFYFYGAEGYKYGTWQMNPSSGVLLQASVAKQWFGGRLVSPEDRLGSKGRYFAFGEERTNVSPSNPANNQERFATYTRDSTTGLDYANQRYFGSIIGRFTRPDPYGDSANLRKPQSWNRYAYVNDDPANATDLNGLEVDAEFESFDGQSSAAEEYADGGGGGGFEDPGRFDSNGNLTFYDTTTCPPNCPDGNLYNSDFYDVPVDDPGVIQAVGDQLNNVSVGVFGYAETGSPGVSGGLIGQIDSSSGPGESYIVSTHGPNPASPQLFVEPPFNGSPTPLPPTLAIPIGFAQIGLIYNPAGTLGVFVGNDYFGAGYYLNLGGGTPSGN